KDGKLLLMLPDWVPGYYNFEPYGRDIFSVAAWDAEGKSLPVDRKGFSGYTIDVNQGPVTVTYQASCYEPDLGDAMGLVDSDYAVLMGTRYLFCPDHLGECSVDYGELPDNWKIHHPSGATREGDANKWVYPGFEILLDTPVCFGNFTLLSKNIDKTPFYFLFVDKGVGFEAKRDLFVDKVYSTAKEMYKIFGLFPFSDYTFVLSLNPRADWGLEHLTSNMSGLGPEVFVDDKAFSAGIRVCAHELFHAWNVRRLRPSPLGQLSHHLDCGCFTEGLWIGEGFTRYYEFLISARVGAYTPDEFFSAIAGYFQHLTQQPAYTRCSVADSSLSTYMNHSKYPGRVNNSIDYYDKGMLIAFGLDARLRDVNAEATYPSLDEAFRAFYLEYFGKGSTVPPNYEGYTTKNAIDFFENVQDGLGPILEGQVEEAGNLDTDAQFEALGFEVNWTETNCLGIFFLNNGEPTIYGVGDTSAAGEVGLAPQDVIQTINGFQFSKAALVWVASQPAPVTLEVLRGHRPLVFKLIPKPFRKLSHLIWKGTEKQAANIRQWLNNEDFNPKAGQKFDLDFYENFHGKETMC
ncbi:MAG: hypothetical protein GY850_45065, partial [bacterium]|nr:hypothetical protein [bacterium]